MLLHHEKHFTLDLRRFTIRLFLTCNSKSYFFSFFTRLFFELQGLRRFFGFLLLSLILILGVNGWCDGGIKRFAAIFSAFLADVSRSALYATHWSLSFISRCFFQRVPLISRAAKIVSVHIENESIKEFSKYRIKVYLIR